MGMATDAYSLIGLTYLQKCDFTFAFLRLQQKGIHVPDSMFIIPQIPFAGTVEKVQRRVAGRKDETQVQVHKGTESGRARANIVQKKPNPYKEMSLVESIPAVPMPIRATDTEFFESFTWYPITECPPI